MTMTKPGRMTSLTNQQEKRLTDYTVKRAEKNVGISSTTQRQKAFNIKEQTSEQDS